MSADPVLALVAELQRRVAKLEARPPAGSEALTPTYLTVTPAGLVGAKFTGLLNALGLILPAGPSSTAANQIQWQRADAAVVAFLTATVGAAPGGSSLLIVRGTTPPDLSHSQADFGAASGAALAQLTTAANAGSSAQVALDVEGPGGTQTPVLMTDTGTSGFLQLLSTQKLQLAIGTATIVGNGTGGQTLSIAHGLGRAPAWAHAQAAVVGGANAYTNETVAFYQAPDANDLYIQGSAVKTNGSTYGYFWAAIG